MDVASRELRNDTRGVLRRVEAGEEVRITVDGRPVALLVPLRSRPRWVPSAQLLRTLQARLADGGLTGDLHELAPDTTDDVSVE